MKINIGDILYHKINSQPMVVIDDIDEDENDYDLNDTVNVRFINQNGEYEEDEFLVAEFRQKAPTKIAKAYPPTPVAGPVTTETNVESINLPIKHIGQPVDQDSNPYGDQGET